MYCIVTFRFKSYKNHLELVLRQFHDVKDSIPAPVKTWFQPHVDVVVTSFQPGLNTLAWNCMNIGNTNNMLMIGKSATLRRLSDGFLSTIVLQL